jgi:asparagine synthetase B (glutamine-hydrolysing)
MAKIAAIILPSNRRAEVERCATEMASLLSLSSAQTVEQQFYRGDTAVCCLLRVLPDALNPLPQPITRNTKSGVMCGYYLPREATSGIRRDDTNGGAPDSATALLRDIAETGLSSLTGADGVYAFALWDSRAEELVAGVDKLGLRPLYWIAARGGGYAVASEIKALIPVAEEPLVNWAAWEEQLAFGFQFGDHTVIRGIHRLGPAGVLTCGAHRMERSQLEQFVVDIDIKPRPLPVVLEETQAAFADSMARCQRALPSTAERMLSLSGGLDSRRIFGSLMEHAAAFDVYTVPFIKSDGREQESAMVAALCRKYGVAGHRVAPPTLEDLFFVRRVRDYAVDFESDEHLYATTLALAIRNSSAVNFDGLGGGILVSGAFLHREFLAKDGDEAFLRSLSRRTGDWYRTPAVDPPLGVRLRTYLRGFGDNPNRHTLFYFLSRTRREIGLASLILEANSFETLFPYVDRGVMTTALSVPPETKMGDKLQRAVMQAFAPHLLEVPTTHDVVPDRQGPPSHPDWRLPRRVQLLEREIRSAGGLGRMGGLGLAERLKLEIAFKFGPVLPKERLRGQYRRGSRLLRLSSYLDATASVDSYTRSVHVLRDLFGSKGEWISNL